jgi:hypothetical protein
MTDRESQVREIAYQLWMQEGQPEGRQDGHWYEAETLYDAEVAGREVKPNPPDEMALSERAVAKAASSDAKEGSESQARKRANRGKRSESGAREARPTDADELSAAEGI